ncbi:MAG: transcriptional regulator [Microbacterium sp. SCN 70-27]|uniref:MarR family winged helix-turn-helix transcriptional regulator n=1 Tax=unclassified Microbacterium TaxID=2609290 RepID=UPI00086C5804|nr:MULTISPECIES: MarR family transcriptional regulator [unclassified Microbacterium]MBN9223563.1 MarR family transcriptional regulator [Microbacterium sp.]ODT26789.1 MAG: transcriptional regulator [Microbacterium sp. SCN 70-27]
MTIGDDILRLVTGAHALSRVASLETRNEAPAAQWRTISILRQHGPLRIGDLAALSRVTQPGMTRLVSQMAEAGLLERGADENDSRATVVSVTPAGLDALDEWMQVLSDALAPRFADLSDDDWVAVRRAAEIVEERTRVGEVTR